MCTHNICFSGYVMWKTPLFWSYESHDFAIQTQAILFRKNTRAQLFKTNDVVNYHIVKTLIIKYAYMLIFLLKKCE